MTLLRTDHVLIGLRGRAVSSTLAVVLAQACQFVVSVVAVVTLARLLTPNDFGLVAMVATIMGFVRILNDAGLATATVQAEDLTEVQVSNLFWANLVIGVTATGFLAAIAPLVAWFFREPRLVEVSIVMACTFAVAGATVQHQALLKRQMRFGAVALIQVIASLCGASVGVILAIAGASHWALVWMHVSTSLVVLGGNWAVCRWTPRLPTRDVGTIRLLRFGLNLTISGLIWAVARGCDTLLIGRYHGPAALGLYTRGSALIYRPLEQAMSPLEGVMMPVFCRLQSDPQRFQRTFFRVYDVVALVSFCAAGTLLPLSAPLTSALLGPQWEGAAAIVAAFTLITLYTPTTVVAGWLLTSQGRGREVVQLSAWSSVATVVAIVTSLPFGPAAVAMAYAASCFIFQLPIAYYIAGQEHSVRTADLWSRFIQHLPLFVATVSATAFVGAIVKPLGVAIHLVIGGAAGVVAGLTLIALYAPYRRTAEELMQAIIEFWHKRESRPAEGVTRL